MYTRDQLAVLDHLGIDTTLVIGCSFIFELLKRAPSASSPACSCSRSAKMRRTRASSGPTCGGRGARIC
jgi:hypothetical protein